MAYTHVADCLFARRDRYALRTLLMALPRDRCALQLYDARHWGVVVRWKNMDAKTDTELVDGKVQSLQPVA